MGSKPSRPSKPVARPRRPASDPTSRIALLDVNVLVALFDPDHVHHDLAHDWFAEEAVGWATCPITEAGFVRIVSNPAYRPDPPRVVAARGLLRTFCTSTQHHFWPVTISLRDASLFSLDAAHGHRQVTDVYLLGLAVAMGGALATFDRTIPLAAVTGAGPEHLTVITPA
jgi:toxin-antitoxin system PIN domain toxin